MRREDYERSYGRRGLPPPVSPSHESTRRSRKSRRKMKCLISVGLILPALAAIIGVAAWAVSADVVMNSNGNRVNKADNQLLQGISGSGRDDRRGDIFQNHQNHQNSGANDRNQIAETQPTQRPTRRTTTTTLAPTPSTADVSAILSKLISASNAASGGSGPRFVVVAPLPDHAQVVPRDDKEPVSIPTISRADHPPTAKFDESWKPTRNEDDSSHDLIASASHQRHHQVVNSPSFHHGSTNLTNRVGLTNNKPSNHHRASDQQQPSFVIDLSNNNNKRRGFNSPVDLSGFEPFMSPDSLLGSQSVAVAGPPPPQVPGYVATGPFKSKNRGSQQGFMNSQRDPPLYEQHHVFNEPASFVNKPNSPLGGFGLKPIQQQQHHLHHHHDSPLVAEESNRWGAVSFHPPPPLPALHIPKPPEGISLSISSPGKGHVHSAEPVSVIKSFFLPFLPKPKLNMNARVVFGVVLDKGMGFGGQKKDAGHLRPY